MLRSLLGEYGPKAKLSGHTLILSLPDAVTPVVWTLDLLKDGHGSLSLHMDGETNEYQLVFSGSREDAPIIEVGRYREKGKAVRALSKATDALEKAGAASFGTDAITAAPAPQGMAYPPYMPKKNGPKQWIISIIAILFIVALFFYGTDGLSDLRRTSLNGLVPKVSQSTGDHSHDAAPARNNPPSDAVGVPMDADNFFGE